MRDVVITQKMIIPIGRRGESNSTRIVFPLPAWVGPYGEGGEFALLVRRYGESTLYPAVVTYDGRNVYWIVTAADTGVSGKGEAQLIYSLGGAIAKTVVFETYVSESIVSPGTIPDPWDDYTAEILDCAQRAEAAAEEAESYGAGSVKWSAAQSLNSDQQAVARENIGALGYDENASGVGRAKAYTTPSTSGGEFEIYSGGYRVFGKMVDVFIRVRLIDSSKSLVSGSYYPLAHGLPLVESSESSMSRPISAVMETYRSDVANPGWYPTGSMNLKGYVWKGANAQSCHVGIVSIDGGVLSRTNTLITIAGSYMMR